MFKAVNKNVNMKSKKIFISGDFNVIHTGHIRLFNFAKSLGDKLIVGVNSDQLAGERSFVNEKYRISNLKHIEFIDSVVLIKNLKKTILEIKPNIIVKGKEYKNIKNLETDFIKKINCKIVFSSGEVTFSSTGLMTKALNQKLKYNLSFPKSYLPRRKIKNSKLKSILKKINKLRVCVIGDLIIDEYINCELLGTSSEEPSLVVKPLNSEKFIGGAGIVASHSQSLGAKTLFVSLIGNDKEKDFIKNTLKKNSLNQKIFIDTLRPTTLKKRFRVENKTLFKVSNLSQETLPIEIEKKILKLIKKNIKKLDAIIFSDYNYGCLSQSLVDNISNLAKKNRIFVSADSQSSSQIGKISRFKNVDLITPTEKEARISVGNNSDGLIILAEKLQKITNCKNLILTLGAEGALINYYNLDKKKYFPTAQSKSKDKLPAFNKFPLDVCGSGDSLLIVSTLAFAAGANIWEAAYLGSLAAAIQSSRIGNIPIKSEEIIDLIGDI